MPMKDLVTEYDCFIRKDSSNNLQPVNHSRINNYDHCQIKSIKYKHKIPNLQMTVEHCGYGSNCKSLSENTSTNIFSEVGYLNHTKSNFAVYYSGNEAHFVLSSRPVLITYAANDVQPEYKKTLKEKSKGDYNNNSEWKKSLETYRDVSKDSKFKFLNDNEKIRQPWIPAVFKPNDNNTHDSKQSLMLCYERDELGNLEVPNKMKSQNAICDVNKIKINPDIKRSNSGSSLESEILHIFLQCNVITFSKLMESIKIRQMVDKSQIIDKTVLNYLPKISLLIRGHFVIKSEILYKFSQKYNDIPIENWCLARDYILSLFYSAETISTTAIKSITSMPSAKITELLENLSERMSDSKNGPWKFPEHDYDFITKNSIFNQQQIEIMDNKVKEICWKLRIDNISKRSRTSSSNSQDAHGLSPTKKRNLDSSPSRTLISKRLRQDSEADSVKSDKLNSRSKSIDHSKKSFAIEYHNIKNEPHLPCVSEMNVIPEEENNSVIKTEISELCSDKNVLDDVHTKKSIVAENDRSNSAPSNVVCNDIKKFLLLQLSVFDVIPIRNLAKAYQQDSLGRLPDVELGSWKFLSNDTLIDSIVEYMENILKDLQATKLNTKWPVLKTALDKQPLYLSNKESTNNDKIFRAAIHLLNNQGCFVLADLKKELMAGEKMAIHHDNMLRDKLKKYCVYAHRKYYLKYTVPER